MAKPHKKKPKRHNPHLLRNAARPPRASGGGGGVRRSGDSADTGGSAPKKTWGTETLKTAGGAAGAALACAYIARENWVPPVFVTGLVTAVGSTLATLGKNETLRQVGAGAMSAAGAQLALILIDNHYDNLQRQKAIATAQAEKAQAEKARAEKAQAEKAQATRSMEGLPPGMLDRAYERARARLGLSQVASQMAA